MRSTILILNSTVNYVFLNLNHDHGDLNIMGILVIIAAIVPVAPQSFCFGARGPLGLLYFVVNN